MSASICLYNYSDNTKCFGLFLLRFLWNELTISADSQCTYGSRWHKLSPVEDHHCCTDQSAATSLLYLCCLSCCSSWLFTCPFTCTLSMQWLTVSQLHDGSDSICVPPPVFKLTSMLATKGERGGSDRVGEKKEGTVFLTHTALSFCSVALLRSAGPPFSQSWTTAKKALTTVCISNIAVLIACISHSQ